MHLDFMRIKPVFAALALGVGVILSAQPVSAATTATVYDCDVAGENDDWITPRYIVIIPDDKSAAYVMDGIISYYNQGEPKKAKLAKDTAMGFHITWTILVRDSYGKMATIHYSADYLKASNQFNVRGIIPNFNNSPFASGTCKVSRE